MSFMSNECGGTLSISQKFRQSAQELKSVRTLTGVSMLLAMSIVISFGSFDRNTEDWVGVSDHRAAGYVVWTVYSSDCSRSRRHHQVSAQTGRRVFLWLYPDGDVGRNGVWMFLVPGKMHHLSCDCIQELNFVAAQLLLEHLLDFPFVWNAVFGCIGSKGD